MIRAVLCVFILGTLLVVPWAQARNTPQNCETELANSDLESYESARALEVPFTTKSLPRQHGWTVTARDAAGHASKARLRILVNNSSLDGKIAVIGPFNDWGRTVRREDWLHPVSGEKEIFTAEIDGIAHGMPYRLLLNGHEVLDPSADMFTTPEYLVRAGHQEDVQSGRAYLNNIFWDAKDPKLYKTETDFVDISDRPVLISEVELTSLAAKFRAADGQLGPPETAETYRFVAKSGVVEKLKEAGYTAVEILPFNQSLDGDSWFYRYQVYGLFAPNSRYGTPDEFKMMIDAFHKAGIAVIMDSVVSHFPFQGNDGVRALEGLGLDQWKKADGRNLYAAEMSPWGTYRYDYENPFLRRFLVDSITHMMSEYKIDGLRIDNTDGILGCPGGEEFLREMALQAREVNSRALIIGEAFFPPVTLLRRMDQGGIGFNTRNDSNQFEIWRNELGGRTEDLNVNAIGDLLQNEFNWREAPMERYLTNHDEAANPRGGFTGSYPDSEIPDPYYAFGKTKAADGLNMVLGAYHLSMLQARMMQSGSFSSNPDVDWSLIAEEGYGKWLWDFFAALSGYIQRHKSYFNFRSMNREMGNHTDNVNKVISVRRRDPDTGRELYVLVNLGHHRLENYRFGIGRQGNYHLGFDSESSAFGGDNALQDALHGNDLSSQTPGAHGKPYSLVVPILAPYSVTILEER